MFLQKYIQKYAWLCLIVCLIIAFFLRVYRLGERGLAGDEKYGLLVSQFMAQEGANQKESIRNPNTPYFTPKQFWKARTWKDFELAISHRENGASALYSLTNHYVSEVFGLTDFVLRFPSIVFNLLTIILLFLFVKRHFNDLNLALLSVFLASISPYLIFFSRIARNYSMLAFWALLGTHLLLIMIDNERKKQNFALYIAYGFVVLANLMTHFAILPLFFIHFLYCLIYLRNKQTWFFWMLSYVIPLLGMVYWLKFSGGQWTLHSIKESAAANTLNATVMPDDWLALTSVKSVSKQLGNVLSMQFLMIDGVSFKMTGLKNACLSIFLSAFWLFVLKKVAVKQWQMGLILGSILVSFFLFSISPTIYLIFSVFLYLLIDFIAFRPKFKNKILVLILLLVIVPILFLILYAIQDGNTMRIMPRYIAYSYIFGLILFAWIILRFFERKHWINYVVGGALLLQFWNIIGFVEDIYLDRPLYYFQAFLSPRQSNPYHQAANKILEVYAKGDTIIYPSLNENTPYKGFDTPEYSVQDAQYVNIYLPKNAEIMQRVNKNEPHRIYCVGENKKILVFDFKGLRY